MEKKVTSIKIDPELWKEVKKYAIDKGTSVSKFIEYFLGILLSNRLERGELSFSTARSDFSWQNGLIDFNAGMLGSHPTRVIGKAINYLYELGKYGPSSLKMCKRLEEEENACRHNLARALGADVNEIIYETNTTKSLRLAFDIIGAVSRFSNKDELLTTDVEHNSARRLIRLKSNLKIKEVPLLSLFGKLHEDEIIELFSSAVDPRTRVLFISHIPYLGGKLPAGEIVKTVKEYNDDIFCIVDGAHTLGQLHVDVKRMDCDFYGVGTHKFGLGVPAFGSLYAKIKYLNELGNRLPVFDSYAVSKILRTDEELGTINGVGVISFNEAFSLIYDYYGIERVQQRITSLAEHFLEHAHKYEETVTAVSPSTPNLISGIVSIAIKKGYSYDKYKRLVERLERRHKIICKAVKRPPCIRACLHYYNRKDEIARFFEVLIKEL